MPRKKTTKASTRKSTTNKTTTAKAKETAALKVESEKAVTKTATTSKAETPKKEVKDTKTTTTKTTKTEVKAEKPAAKATVKKAEAKEEKPAAKTTVKKAEVKEEKPAAKTTAKKAEVKEEKPAAKTTAKKAEVKEEKPAAKTTAKKAEVKAEKPAAKTTAKKAEVKEEKPAAKTTAKKAEVKEEKPAAKKTKKTTAKKAAPKAAKAEVKEEPKETVKVEAPKAEAEAPKAEVKEEPKPAPQPELPQPRRSVAFIGSECYPFVKTGGLGDVMYALPKALAKQNCDVKVILPRYACIPQEYQEKMVFKGAFDMDLCSDGRSYYVGIMEYVWDGVVYDFIDNMEFFSNGNPYTNLVDDIPKFCYFGKAALAALNFMDWEPDVIHCHDWQASLVPLYLRTMFDNTPIANAKVIMTIHNLRFQGVYNIETLKYWTNLPDYVFNKDCMTENWLDANMLKGGLTYCNAITTVSNTYAGEIQTPEYGEGLDAHLRYHSGKLRGIVNGIDYDIFNPATDPMIPVHYDLSNVLENKPKNKRALQEELGLQVDENKFVIGLISRLTDQKGLDLVNQILPQIVDDFTEVVILGTGQPEYEDSFRYYENAYKGRVCANIMYDETRSHHIYAGCDALLVPSRFEPCGLTQLIGMHYGDIPIVRETGGLKDTVEPYNEYANTGNGFTFDRYDAGLLLDAINRAKTFYFTNRWCFDEMVQRNMDKDVSWENSAKQYRDLYVALTTD
ncbi:MAG: glycogen/starch synthase [Intestinibaculum porci]|uniref:glycogen/starch synthase n=1 Tax=Intestinibaculum porci TaxID=2487118 RepID=UPI003F070D34